MSTTACVPKYWKFIPNIFVWDPSAAEMLIIDCARWNVAKPQVFSLSTKWSVIWLILRGGKKWLDRECCEIFQLSLSSDTTAGKCLLRCANWQESQKEKTGIFYYAFHLLLNVHLCSFAVWRSLAIANGFATLASEKVSHPVIEINGFLQF